MAQAAVDGLAFPDHKKTYIVQVLDPVLEEMVQEVLDTLPPQPMQFMIEWLKKRSGKLGPSSKLTMKERNRALQQELRSLSEFVAEASVAISEARLAKPGDDEEEEEEDDDDEGPDEPLPPPQARRGQRTSVSAEAYGAWNTKTEFVAPKHPKTEEQTANLKAILLKSFLFSELSEADLNVILLAISESSFEAGTRIITEGEDGDCLYLIESGAPVCKKTIDGEMQVVKTCKPGDVFGELALLYNNPRAATVEAIEACKCWRLDRDTFTNVVTGAASRKSLRYEGFLKNVPVLANMTQLERAALSDALFLTTYAKGDEIVKQGERGDTFYLVEDGGLDAKKRKDGEDKVVLSYGAGDYFGELALLKDQPRAATVVVTSDTAKVLTLGRKNFKKLLGPIEDLLLRGADEKYK